MGRKYTFLGLAEATRNGTAPKMIKVDDSLYRLVGKNYVSVSDYKYSLLCDAYDRMDYITDYLTAKIYEAVNVVAITAEEANFIESLCELHDQEDFCIRKNDMFNIVIFNHICKVEMTCIYYKFHNLKLNTKYRYVDGYLVEMEA